MSTPSHHLTNASAWADAEKKARDPAKSDNIIDVFKEHVKALRGGPR